MTDVQNESRRTLNLGTKPRVLYLLDDDDAELLPAESVEPLVGSLRRIQSLSDVDLSEWDALVTSESLGRNKPHEGWTRTVPETLCVFVLIDPRIRGILDFQSSSMTSWRAGVDGDVPGHHIELVEGLPLELEELVKSDLQRAVSARTTQFGVRFSGSTNWQEHVALPFAYGPTDLVLAGKYRFGTQSTVWCVPNDVHDMLRWFKGALRDWASSFPKNFPSMPDWQDTEKWATVDEGESIRAIAELNAERRRVISELDDRQNDLARTLDGLRSASQSYEKILLTGQSDELQSAVSRALVELGFKVRDMDEVWPTGMRREDIRVTDPDFDGWLALGEITGTKKGLGQEKITRATNHLMKHVLDERPVSAPPMWVIVNQFIEKDPAVRHEILNSDAIDMLREGGNLVIDTVALFVLLRGIRLEPGIAARVREVLRTASGRFGVPEAESVLVSVATV